MTDMLSDELTQQLRWFQHGNGPLVLFTGSSLDGERLVGPARLLAGQRTQRAMSVWDDRSSASSTATLTSWNGLPELPVSNDLAGDLEGFAVAAAIDLPGNAQLLERHVALLRSAAERGARVFSADPLGAPHANIIQLRRTGVTGRVRFADNERHSTRVLVHGTAAARINGAATEASLRLNDSLAEAGVVTDWLPSSPLGLLLRGFGRCLDNTGLDQGAGVVEALLQIIEPQADVIVLEGSGSLLDPSTSARTILQATVARPKFHVIAHRVAAKDDQLLEVLDDLVARLDRLHSFAGHPSILLGVTLDTSDVPEWDARSLLAEVDRSCIRCVDVADGLAPFARIVAAHESTA